MRVTNKQMLNFVTRSVATSSEQLMKVQEQVASTKTINRPSDDPAGMNKVLDYRRRIASIDQYLRNITAAKTRVEMNEIQLEEVHGLLGDAKQIAIDQSSGSDESGRESAAKWVGDIYDQVRGIANTRLGGAYLFAGHNTDTMPFPNNKVITEAASELSGGEYLKSSDPDYYLWYDIDNNSTDPKETNPSLGTGIEVNISSGDTAKEVAQATRAAIYPPHALGLNATGSGDEVIIVNPDGKGVEIKDGNTQFDLYNATYNGDSGEINTIVGEGMSFKTNIHGNEAFTGSDVTDGVDILETLQNLKEALEAEPYDREAVSTQADKLVTGIAQIEEAMSRQATTLKRLDQTEERWNNLKNVFEGTLSKTEDADMAQAVVELKSQQTAYEMALASAAGMLQQNLLDFLR